MDISEAYTTSIVGLFGLEALLHTCIISSRRHVPSHIRPATSYFVPSCIASGLFQALNSNVLFSCSLAAVDYLLICAREQHRLVSPLSATVKLFQELLIISGKHRSYLQLFFFSAARTRFSSGWST